MKKTTLFDSATSSFQHRPLNQLFHLLFAAATLLLTVTTSFSQAPLITKNVSIPTGTNSGKGIAYGNGKYIAIIATNRIYQSADGVTWAKVSEAGYPAANFNSIAFGAGVFVIVGNNGEIISSADGENWTSRTSLTTEPLNDVKFYLNTFFAVGRNTTLRSSADGITWNSVSIGAGTASDNFLSITYGNNLLVISARNSGHSFSYVYKSATGASNSWTFQNLGIGTLNRVQFIHDRFFAFVAGHQVNTSPDGNTWTNVTASITLTLPDASPGTWNASNQIFNGFHDGTNFYFFGSSQYYSGYGSVWRSSTGTDLTLQTRTAYMVPQGSGYINGRYFQWGNEGVVSSDDGLTYRYPTGNYYAMASSGNSYVGVGAVSQSGIIFRSADFNTWTETTPLSQREVNTVLYDGTRYLAAGNRTILESTDEGHTWNQLATPNDVYMAMSYNSSRYVGAFYDAITWDVTLGYSSNGTSWTNTNADNNYYFRIKHVNGNVFALGYSNDTWEGVILYSSNNGNSWTDITPNLAYPVYYFSDVAYDGSKYHFMGIEYTDLVTYGIAGMFTVSTSTLTNPNSFANKGSITSPVGPTLGGTYGEGIFAYDQVNGKFLGAVVDVDTFETYIIHSDDGVSWTAIAQDENASLFAMLQEGTQYRMMGYGDGKFTVSYSSTLPVQLAAFTATAVNKQSLLRWETSQEINSREFIVQHSSNATAWQTIGTVMAAGNSNQHLQYEFTHSHPFTGHNYYRLVQTDLDNKQYISPVRKLLFGKALQVQIYPNPATDKANLLLPASSAAVVSIVNATGQQVFRQTFNGNNNIQLPLEQLQPGVYRIRVQQNGEMMTAPFIKK